MNARNTLLIILAVLILAAFSNSFSAQLTLDSNAVIVNDSRIHQLTFDNLITIFTSDYWFPATFGLFRPITTSSYLFNYALLGNGANPAGYHWINLFLHWVNASLAFLIGISFFHDRLAAFFSAALFALHPITTEAVTNIAGRADLLSACAVLGGFFLYLESKKHGGHERARYIGALMLVALAGVLAKENAVVLVVLMALYDLAFRKIPPVKAAYAAVLAALAIAASVRWLVFRHAAPVPDQFLDNPLLGAAFWTGRLTAIAVLAKELWLLVWPLHLSASYSFNQIPMFRWSDWHTVAEIAAVAAAAALFVFAYRWNRTIFFSLGWLLLALIPTANLVVLIGSIMAERFLYLPLFGFAACVVFALMKIPRVAAAALLAAIVAGCGVRTYLRNFDWQDNLHLWMSAEKVTPNSYAVHLWLAAAWFNKQPAGAEVDRAIAEGEKAAAIADMAPVERRITPLYVPLAISYRVKGAQASQSEQRYWYQKSVDLLTACIPLVRSPGDYKLYENMGLGLLLLGERQRALDALQTMQRMAPLNPDSGLRLGDAWLAMGRPDEAVIAFEEAFIAAPDHPEVNQRLAAVYPKVDPKGCAVDIDNRINPFCSTVHQNLCLAYTRLSEILARGNRVDLVQHLRNGALADGCRPE